MPMPFVILPAFNLIAVWPTGLVDHDDVLTYFRAARAHPDHRPGLDRLVISSALDNLDIGFDAMRSLRAQDLAGISSPVSWTASPGRTVFVDTAQGHLGMARMYQSLAEIDGDTNVHVVETLDDALRLLGHDPHVLGARLLALSP